MKNILKSKRILITIMVAVIILLLLVVPIKEKSLFNILQNKFFVEEESGEVNDGIFFSYEKIDATYGDLTCIYKILITVTGENGLKQITYPGKNEKIILNCNNENTVAIDFEAVEGIKYNFDIQTSDDKERTEVIQLDRNRVGEDTYELVNGVYLNTPYLEGFNEKYTRYAYSNQAGNIVPGNWINGEKPDNWYDYGNRKWANIYVETEGVEAYLVWIPRYVYKLDTENSVSGNERMDVKFVDVYNNYIDKDGKVTTGDELMQQGYKLPEAFTWNGSNPKDMTEISGYWISKYQLSELTGNYNFDYDVGTDLGAIKVRSFTSKIAGATSYTYAVNGQIVNISVELDNYTFRVPEEQKENVVNVTALNEKGEVLGSMTKIIKTTIANAPDLTEYDKNTTFYVYYDTEGNEHNEIPISKEAPETWYDYSEQGKSANIVTRINGVVTYYEWVPRYEYKIDQITGKIKTYYVEGTSTETTQGYTMAEGFEKDGIQLTGYWKQTSTKTEAENLKLMRANLIVNGSSIEVVDIAGTLIREGLRYEYYLDAELKHEGTSATEGYIYDNIEQDREYIVTIIARDVETNAYVGAYLEKIETVEANAPDLTGFDPTITYYVYWDENGNEHSEIPVTKQAPEGWYNYSTSEWANIVVRNNGLETYLVWIPRYQYKVNSDIQRTYVRFLKGTNTETAPGYAIPEAFSWGDNLETQLTGYWITKYQLSEVTTPVITSKVIPGENWIRIKDITGTGIKEGLTYEYYIDGELKHTAQESENYTFNGLEANKTYVVNVIARDTATNAYIGTASRKVTTAKANVPELESFDKDTTFYVYYDAEGNEHNEIPISKEAPETWYDYSDEKSANIVTRINGVVTYYEWVPRYQIGYDEVRKENHILYIPGTGTDVLTGYSIPEEFTRDGNEITGYWKQTSTKTEAENLKLMRVNTIVNGSAIEVVDIAGTLIREGLRYEYYLDAELKHEGTSATEGYIYDNLEQDREYIVTIIARDSGTNAYVGAYLERIETVEANSPDLTGFNPNITYYVYWDEDGNEHSDIPISQQAPAEWYDYGESKWANIVIKNTQANAITYLTWIPRYQYKVNNDTQRVYVKFLKGTNTKVAPGYAIPEAFRWGDNLETQLTGYWITKYQLSE